MELEQGVISINLCESTHHLLSFVYLSDFTSLVPISQPCHAEDESVPVLRFVRQRSCRRDVWSALRRLTKSSRRIGV